MSTMAPPPEPVVRHDVAHGHRAGTSLDDEHHVSEQRLPGLRVGFVVFAILFVVYALIGYQVTVNDHVVVFDALDRLTRAYLVWHNDPPKLAAIGFVFPPLTTMAFLGTALVKPLATSLIALPLTSAFFSAGTVAILDRTLARCDMAVILRLPLLAGFALNPLWVFYAGNGMSESVYCFFLAFTLYTFVSWYATTEPRFLIGAGFGLSVLVLVRYAFIIWAALFAVLIAVALVRRRASKIEVEGSVIAFAAPIIYVLALWILFNALIVGDPFGWLSDVTTSTQAVNATGIDEAGRLGFNEVASRLLELNVAVFPLAFLAVPALVLTFIAQRNDMALWLAAFIVLGIVIIGAHAYTAEREGLLTLRDSLPMAVAAFVGAAWVFRSVPAFRLPVWGLTMLLLVVGLFTAWHGMRNYPFQSLEQAFTRAVSGGGDQENEPSRGGYRVGIAPEARMAQFMKGQIAQRKDSVLADNAQTFGVIMLYGRPQNVFDRIDEGDTKFNQVVAAPYGKVDYLLVARNERGGDVILKHFPQIDQGSVPGLVPVFRTERYVLVHVAGRRPAAAPARRRAGAAATAPTATTPSSTTTTAAP